MRRSCSYYEGTRYEVHMYLCTMYICVHTSYTTAVLCTSTRYNRCVCVLLRRWNFSEFHPPHHPRLLVRLCHTCIMSLHACMHIHKTIVVRGHARTPPLFRPWQNRAENHFASSYNPSSHLIVTSSHRHIVTASLTRGLSRGSRCSCIV